MDERFIGAKREERQASFVAYLKQNPVRLVTGEAIRRWRDDGHLIPRYQDLLKGDYVEGRSEEMNRLLDTHEKGQQLPIICISHKWRTKEHPDPTMRQLEAMANSAAWTVPVVIDGGGVEKPMIRKLNNDAKGADYLLAVTGQLSERPQALVIVGDRPETAIDMRNLENPDACPTRYEYGTGMECLYFRDYCSVPQHNGLDSEYVYGIILPSDHQAVRSPKENTLFRRLLKKMIAFYECTVVAGVLLLALTEDLPHDRIRIVSEVHIQAVGHPMPVEDSGSESHCHKEASGSDLQNECWCLFGGEKYKIQIKSIETFKDKIKLDFLGTLQGGIKIEKVLTVANTTYVRRGWCFFEMNVACLTRGFNNRYAVWILSAQDFATAISELAFTSSGIFRACFF